ncbi:F0F1 ATP synthase subunit epsilon [Helicobacter pylori]|uniref:ATP synthase epsilon chain n=3 Tax=Helicobacter pylori TaxID=210 RepID=T2S788_HELPX|nr:MULTISPECIES: ATP synthase F1 subunit epsilon [Helicobacter]AGT74429.1 ATP synthase F1, epsilon subunit [Helicobacter pylori SouthAfrica20]EQD88288.1 ATP synthase F1, epsilon subunit [Helicobacter pylori SouthAfrica50]ANH48539.1 ATP synthase F0F1 subunit epsilon [Helicobacter pylori]WQU97805.1 F0F1 ATP synthase subunit epsilon [Helicobacter pylori]WQV00610.1 F0F1 ATP synthase subunit epsilon [Helicobacter pylori]
MALLKISVVVPEGEVYTGEVKSVVLPGVEGEFGVLYGHSNMITLLQAGVIEIETESQKEHIAISWGYAEVTGEHVDILADGAVFIKKESDDRDDAISRAKRLLEDASSDRLAVSSVLAKIESL